jgi:hypothetical protein
MLIKIALLLLIASVGVLLVFISVQVANEKEYFDEKIKTGIYVENMQGKIKTAKTFYAGRTHNNIKIYVPAPEFKKWIYFMGVDEDDKNALLQTGSDITLQAYPRPYSSLLIDNKYFKDTVLYGLGYSVNGKEIKSNEDMYKKKSQHYSFMMVFLIFSFLLVIFSWFLVLIFGDEGNMVLRRKKQ